MKKLTIGNVYVELGNKIAEKKREMIDLTEDMRILKIRQTRVYLDEQGQESKPAKKGVLIEGKPIEIKKMKAGTITAIKGKINKAELENYAEIGLYEIYKTSLELQPDEAFEFNGNLTTGFATTIHKHFIFKDRNENYWLKTTTIETIEKLRKGRIEAKTEMQELVNPLEELKKLGIVA